MSGKWDDASVPKRGWECTGVEDLLFPTATCEMCEVRVIRYVHAMEHADYPIVLHCGCICAGHMEGSPDAAIERERIAHNLTKRRAAWPDLQTWKVSENGNPHIKQGDYHVILFPKGDGWSGLIVRGDWRRFAKRVYPTLEAAKLAAFDALVALQRRGSNLP